jgi:hypothetical protein
VSRSVETAAKQLNKRSIVSLSTMGNYSGSRGDIQKQQRPPKRQRQRRLNLNFEVSKGEEKERTSERTGGRGKREEKKTAIKEKSERMLHRSDSCPFEGGKEAKEGGSGEGRKDPNISARASACRLSLLSAKK